jgi:hypothetical protein
MANKNPRGVQNKFKIVDAQGMGTHADELFDTKEEIREHLISYHSVDWTEERDINSLTLEEIQDYGEWDIEEVEVYGITCPLCGEFIEAKNIEDEVGHITGYTIWSCKEACPFVGFEYSDKRSLDWVVEYLKK